jgi:nucleolar MIF4G domain-containing protein 1
MAGPAAQGEAQRELVRVPVECCLQERAWNPYYGHLLGRLAAAAKGHRITLQFCLWDHFKQARARRPPGA